MYEPQRIISNHISSPKAAMYLDILTWGGGGILKKVTNYFTFKQLYSPDHKETINIIACSRKFYAISQNED